MDDAKVVGVSISTAAKEVHSGTRAVLLLSAHSGNKGYRPNASSSDDDQLLAYSSRCLGTELPKYATVATPQLLYALRVNTNTDASTILFELNLMLSPKPQTLNPKP